MGWRFGASVATMLIAAATLIGCGRQPEQENAGSPAPAPVIAPAPTTAPGAIAYLNASDSGAATVSGTSTLHDWSAKSTSIEGSVVCIGNWSDQAPSLDSIQLSIAVNSLHSSEGGGMDKTMYDALKMKANPFIAFKLNSAKLKSAPTKDDPKFHYQVTGQLTIAGSSRNVDLSLDILPSDSEGKLTIQTRTQMKMTDFGVDPPTAMLGMIKSGDQVTVDVTWQLSKRAP